MMLPLIRALEKSARITVLGLTTAGAVLRKENIPYLGFKDFLKLPGDQRAIDIGKKLLPQNTHTAVAEDESIAYLGMSYVDLELVHGKELAAKEFEKSGRRGFLPLATLGRILDRIQPDLLIATNSPRAERAAIVSARRRGIPAICLVDLFARDFTREWVTTPGYANRICVLSEEVKNDLVQSGAKSSEIAVTGNPAFDRLADPQLAERAKEFEKKHGLSGKKKICLALSLPEGPDQHLPGKIVREMKE